MVSAPSSRSNPDRGHFVVFLGQTLYSVPLSPQLYKRVPANLMPGVGLLWTGIPSMESRNTSNRFVLQKPG